MKKVVGLSGHLEWNDLVIIADGKSLPYLHIPDQFDEDTLAAVLEKLNTVPNAKA